MLAQTPSTGLPFHEQASQTSPSTHGNGKAIILLLAESPNPVNL
jgi:hypothetical protein